MKRRSSIDQPDAALSELLAAGPRADVLKASRQLGVACGTVQAERCWLRDRGVITGESKASRRTPVIINPEHSCRCWTA